MKQILMVSSEAVPYIKTGGLADVAGSLPKYLNKEEYDTRVMLPKYACMTACWDFAQFGWTVLSDWAEARR